MHSIANFRKEVVCVLSEDLGCQQISSSCVQG
jgi:hypothetical protein